MSTTKLTWLHLSDIHFLPKTEWHHSPSRTALLTYIKELFKADPSLIPDLIFCTGDVAFGQLSSAPISNQYGQAKDFFEELLQVCGQDGKAFTKTRLFVVPGNHDVNRSSINQDAQENLRNWAREPNKHVSKINQRFSEKPLEFTDAMKRLFEYGKFIEEYLPHQIDPEGRFVYSSIVDINGIKVGIGGLNSAWSCSGNEEEKKVWLPGEFQYNFLKPKLKDADIRIGLIHHPIDWFNAVDQDIAMRRISADFHFWLHGHMHNAWVEPSYSHVTIAAGAVGADSSEEFGINITKLDFSGDQSFAYLHGYKPQDDGWTIFPVAKHAPDGKWRFQLPSELQKKSSVIGNDTLPIPGLIPALEQPINLTQKISLSEEMLSFLQDTEILTKAHSQKEKVFVDDIFVFPDLEKFDFVKEFEKKINSEVVFNDFEQYTKIVFVGENQSGKTTLCKKLFLHLREKEFFPVFISEESSQYQGKIINNLEKSFEIQYIGVKFKNVSDEKIVPILDNFHLSKNRDGQLNDLSRFKHQVLVVDDIFSLNIKEENIIETYTHFKIREFQSALRNTLIKKWTYLTETTTDKIKCESDRINYIDRTTELVNTSLGKMIGEGIMPSYPFFILSIISAFETFRKPLDQEITSQGHCYQALITICLNRQGVENDDIDTYVNFLTAFAHYFFREKKQELSIDEFNVFMGEYLEAFHLPIKPDILMNTLLRTQILILDKANNYSFGYPYLYYFFVAKYLADNISQSEKIIDSLVDNLHKDENAYIAIFISHHSRNPYLIEQLLNNACCLFDKFSPASLTKDDTEFFDQNADKLIKSALPLACESPEKAREKLLKAQDEYEDMSQENGLTLSEDSEDIFELDLRRSVKTVEVMGQIIKNRAGSLERKKLELMFEEAMNIHLRILSSFFDLIRDESNQDLVVKFFMSRLESFLEETDDKRREEGKAEKKYFQDELEEIATKIFWFHNFYIVFGMIDKVISSLGTNKMTSIIDQVCDRIDTPAADIVRHGIFMKYNKNLQIEKIGGRIKRGDFSKTSKKLLDIMVVDFCTYQPVDYKIRQKIQNRLNIPANKILLEQVIHKKKE